MTPPNTPSPKRTHMSSNVPTRKLQVGVITAALVTIIISILNQRGANISADVANAILTIVSALVAYFVPPSANDQVVVE